MKAIKKTPEIYKICMIHGRVLVARNAKYCHCGMELDEIKDDNL